MGGSILANVFGTELDYSHNFSNMSAIFWEKRWVSEVRMPRVLPGVRQVGGATHASLYAFWRMQQVGCTREFIRIPINWLLVVTIDLY